METKSNQILVGMITLLLIALAAAFALWLARMGEGTKNEYDIFFQQSVGGLTKGSSVTFSGVPIGQVKEVKLWYPDPDFIRVRVVVDAKTPILVGTTATITTSGFTGPTEILLAGAVKGAPRIVCPKENMKASCPVGVPVIPTKPGALGELLNGAPLLLQRLSTLTDRLNNVLSDKNQVSLEKIMVNVEGVTAATAREVPAISASIQAAMMDARATLAKAGETASQLTAMANNANGIIDSEGKPMIADLRKTIAQANSSLTALQTTIQSTGPAIDTLSSKTLPEFNQLARDLRELSKSLKTVTERLDQQGVTGLVSAPALPDYEPEKAK